MADRLREPDITGPKRPADVLPLRVRGLRSPSPCSPWKLYLWREIGQWATDCLSLSFSHLLLCLQDVRQMVGVVTQKPSPKATMLGCETQ